jgi:hypothetical protein
MDRAVDEVVAVERWRGVGYLLVGSGIAAIVWEVVHRRRWRTRRLTTLVATPPARPSGEVRLR